MNSIEQNVKGCLAFAAIGCASEQRLDLVQQF